MAPGTCTRHLLTMCHQANVHVWLHLHATWQLSKAPTNFTGQAMQASSGVKREKKEEPHKDNAYAGGWDAFRPWLYALDTTDLLFELQAWSIVVCVYQASPLELHGDPQVRPCPCAAPAVSRGCSQLLGSKCHKAVSHLAHGC